MNKKVEVTYRKPGERWKRKTVTERNLERVVLKLEDDGAEILVRDERTPYTKEHPVRHLMIGIILGAVMTGGLVSAGTFYDSKGNVQAPRGSQQSFDYFRERQLFLDAGAVRRNSDEQRRLNPCAR
jgi:hypothetical protein